MAHIPYTSGVGRLIYNMMCIHLNIYYTFRLVSRFQVNPSLAYYGKQ